MITSPFPQEIAFAAVHIADLATCTLLNEEQAILGENASEKRVQEFTLGRAAAHRALEQLGYRERFAILKGEGREPIWPPYYVGSITHSNEWGIAAASSDRTADSIGIDLQLVPEEFNLAVLDRIAFDSEKRWVLESNEPSRNFALLFSAKESVYKALFPLTNRVLGFKEAELVWDPRYQSFEARLLTELGRGLGRNLGLQIKTISIDKYVFTGTFLGK